ncbi:Putative LOC100210866 [Caligus rogercresseyi]|uniref:LOC100210866 n=1 Tax=Caligus rogercresseyi TaxID=217165 RepID=A0A7T8KLA9_CALRO|nr:Putative LOC100210866 [Caligus rogercresseyi]
MEDVEITSSVTFLLRDQAIIRYRVLSNLHLIARNQLKMVEHLLAEILEKSIMSA